MVWIFNVFEVTATMINKRMRLLLKILQIVQQAIPVRHQTDNEIVVNKKNYDTNTHVLMSFKGKLVVFQLYRQLWVSLQ